MSAPWAGCKVCEGLTQQQLVELDLLLMSDPETWPDTLFEGIEPPPGVLRGRWRTWGACRMAKEWLADRGLLMPLTAIRAHYERHLPEYPSETAAVQQQGHLNDGAAVPASPSSFLAARDFRNFFMQGMGLGDIALKKLKDRIENDPEVPDHLLVEVAKLASQLARAQYSVMARVVPLQATGDPEGEEEDELGGFAGEGKLAHNSVRMKRVNGSERPVVDKGPADWFAHNERADREGTDRILT